MTQLYTAFTCKLLMQHLSSSKEEGKTSPKIRSLEEVPAHVRGRLLEMCKVAWEGMVQQQLTFSSAVAGGQTLGLMKEVRELYGGEEGKLSYHFIHLTLQEFLSAYHIAQLPLHKQEEVINKHINTGHLKMVIRFYFGLAKLNPFAVKFVTEKLSSLQWESSLYHWLFEAGDEETITKAMGSASKVKMEATPYWTPLDYYVLGHCVSHYNFDWELKCWHASMGSEEMEMLCKGMAMGNEKSWSGKIDANFSYNDITWEGMQWFVRIPHHLAQHILSLDFGGNQLDEESLDILSELVPNLTSLQELVLWSNPIESGGAVKLLNQLTKNKTPLKRLDIANTRIEEKDSEKLAGLIEASELDYLRIFGDLLSCRRLRESFLSNKTIHNLNLSDSSSPSDSSTPLNTEYLASILEQAECPWKKLEIRNCHINEQGAKHLAEALTKNNSLTKLDISENPIGETGAAAFRQALQKNSTVQVKHNRL